MHCPARLCILLILRGRRDAFLAMIAVCCSSFVLSSRGSSKRSELTPMGFEMYEKVAVANLLAARQGWCNIWSKLVSKGLGPHFDHYPGCYFSPHLPLSLPLSVSNISVSVSQSLSPSPSPPRSLARSLSLSLSLIISAGLSLLAS